MEPQPGIFVLETSDHVYLEFDLRDGAAADAMVARLAELATRETQAAGVHIVVAFWPELWDRVSPRGAGTVTSFATLKAADWQMPSTQHDAWLWVAGEARGVVWETSLRIARALDSITQVASDVSGWIYRQERDLTGFIDGTENPPPDQAPSVAANEEGTAVVLVQQWRHLSSFAALPLVEQQAVIGRTKVDSEELGEDLMPVDSHVARTVIEEDGNELAIYRRNTAYGGVTDHGTMFVGFCRDQHPLQVMLERMAGEDGIRDALTRHTVPLTGAYYLAPSPSALSALRSCPEGPWGYR